MAPHENWGHIRQALSNSVYEEQVATPNGGHRLVYRVRPEVAAELAAHCVYVERGRSGKTGAAKRPLFERMKRNGNSTACWCGKYLAWAETCVR
jgi:hypothetical protein